MSSNIKTSRICDYCGTAFLARTTVTRFCGKSCNSRFYKKQIRDKKLLKSLEESREKLINPISTEVATNRPVLNIVEACQLLGVSRTTLWRLIKNDRIKVTMIGRRVIIARADIFEFIKL